MSFGYGVGNFLSVADIAWRVYKSCKGAPECFGEISLEVLSLHAVLKEAEETVLAQPLSPIRRERRQAIAGSSTYLLPTSFPN
jgi:hypothetical protein